MTQPRRMYCRFVESNKNKVSKVYYINVVITFYPTLRSGLALHVKSFFSRFHIDTAPIFLIPRFQLKDRIFLFFSGSLQGCIMEEWEMVFMAKEHQYGHMHAQLVDQKR